MGILKWAGSFVAYIIVRAILYLAFMAVVYLAAYVVLARIFGG